MSGLILLAMGLVGQWLLGFAIANGLAGQSTSSSHVGQSHTQCSAVSLAERIGLGFILGIGATVAILFSWSMLGGPLGRGVSLTITAIGFLLGGLVVYRDIQRHRARARAGRLLKLDQRLEEVSERSWCNFCRFIIGLLFVATTIQSLLTPQHLWDERASFAIKGIVLAEDLSIDSRDLADPNFVQFHPRYPLLIPLAEQHMYSLLGTVDDRLSKLIFPELYLGLVLTTVGGLARHLTPGSAWLFGLFTATMPVLVPWEYGFPCGQADASMACFHGISALYVWNSWRMISLEKPANCIRSSFLAGICGALAAFTKDEGIAFLMVDVIAVLIVILFSRQLVYGAGILFTVFGVASILLLPWILHRQRLPLTTEANYFGRASMTTLMQKQANLAWEVPHLAERMFMEFREWGLQWWLMLYGIIAVPSRMLASSQLFLMLDVAGAIASLILAGMLAATEVTEHIGGSSHRYLMQLAPVAILFAAGQLGHLRPRPPIAFESSQPAI